MVALMLLGAALLLVFLVGLLQVAEVYRDVPKPSVGARPSLLEGGPLLSIVIPARDEEDNIGICLRSVLAQSYRRIEVIVVDDGSTDRTAEIVRELAAGDERVRLLQGAPLPPGWSGRVHACAQGSALARGEYLLVLDADTRLLPDGLASALAYAVDHTTDLLAVLPRTEVGRFWENQVQSMMGHLFVVGFDAHALNDPEHPKATAWGGFLLFRREAYERIGGHREMQGVVVDGPQLAVKIKQRRMRLAYVLGSDVVVARMHARFSSVWNGWTRSIYLGLDRSVARAALAVVGLALLLVVPWVIFGASLARLPLVGFSREGIEFALLWGGVLLAAVANRVMVRNLFRLDVRWSWLAPLGALLVIAIIGNSFVRVWSGRAVTWRGRVYPTTG